MSDTRSRLLLIAGAVVVAVATPLFVRSLFGLQAQVQTNAVPVVLDNLTKGRTNFMKSSRAQWTATDAGYAAQAGDTPKSWLGGAGQNAMWATGGFVPGRYSFYVTWPRVAVPANNATLQFQTVRNGSWQSIPLDQARFPDSGDLEWGGTRWRKIGTYNFSSGWFQAYMWSVGGKVFSADALLLLPEVSIQTAPAAAASSFTTQSATRSSSVPVSPPACGNGRKEGTERCDDGNWILTDACVNCQLPRCGDMHVQTGVEQCDDGNSVATDGCYSCKFVADISTTLSAPASAQSGGILTYNLRTLNAGPGTGASITTWFGIPPGLVYQFSHSSGSSLVTSCSAQSGAVVCWTSALPRRGTDNHVIAFKVTSAACNSILAIQATASGTMIDPNPANNVSPVVSTTISCPSTACIDSDSGMSPQQLYEPGFVRVGDQVIGRDYCMSEAGSVSTGPFLAEHYCENNKPKFMDYFRCPSGCENGACRPENPCGNNRLDPGEQCDDGNTAPADECSPACRFEFCGDGIAQPPQEQCDDGNFTAGDGCSPRCRVQ